MSVENNSSNVSNLCYRDYAFLLTYVTVISVISGAASSQMSSERTEILIVNAGRRSAVEGDLYDVNTDSFTSRSIFDKNLNNVTFISKNLKRDTDYKFLSSNSYEGKLKDLDISGHFGVSILSGLVTLSGAGKYVTSEASNSKSVKGSLLYRYIAEKDTIKLSSIDFLNHVSKNVFILPDSTHFVSGITRGCNAIIEFETFLDDEKNFTSVMGNMEAAVDTLKAAFSVNAAVQVSHNNNKDKFNEIKNFKVFVDFHMDVIPQTIEELLEFTKTIPEKCKTQVNEISYELYPLSKLKILLEQILKQTTNSMFRLYNKVEEDVNLEIVRAFDKAQKTNKKITDVELKIMSYSDYVSQTIITKINDLRHAWTVHYTKFAVALKDTLAIVREGKNSSSELTRIINDFTSHDMSPAKVLQKLR